MQLSLEPSERIQFFCVAAFRYMSEQPELAISMIDEGAIATISELCSTKTDEFTGTSLAIALVNLTRINGHCFKCHLCVILLQWLRYRKRRTGRWRGSNSTRSYESHHAPRRTWCYLRSRLI